MISKQTNGLQQLAIRKTLKHLPIQLPSPLLNVMSFKFSTIRAMFFTAYCASSEFDAHNAEKEEQERNAIQLSKGSNLWEGRDSKTSGIDEDSRI